MCRGLLPLLLLCFALLLLAACGGEPEDGADTLETATTGREQAGTTSTLEGKPAPASGISTDADAKKAKTFRVSIQDGVVEATPGRWNVRKGDTVTLLVSSDVADEVHVHGYDHKVDLKPGRTAKLTFEADLQGGYEVELEQRHVPIGTLYVH